MRKRWVVCALVGAAIGTSFGNMAWGQAAPGAAAAPKSQAPAAPAQAMPAQPPSDAGKPPAPAPEVAMSAVVLTIKGVCPATTAAPAAGSKTAAAGKTAAAAKKPADCKTELTRAQFEKIASGLSPNITPQLKRQLEQALPRFMAMSEIAKKKGLDKSPAYLETLKVAKMQILTTQLQRQAGRSGQGSGDGN